MKTDLMQFVQVFRRLSAVLPAVLLATACSSGLLGTPQTHPGEVEELKRRVVELQRRATVAELEGARLKREIVRLEAELEKTSRETGKPLAAEPLAAAVEAEPTAPSAIGLGQVIEETDLEETPADPVATDPVATDPVAAEPVAPDVDTSAEEDLAATTVPTAQAQALYDDGYGLFHQQRYADAEARFRRYVKLYPRTDLADNALFWIGECRYARGDFSAALEAFSGTVERYPHGNKISDALFKAGKCLESLGDTGQARSTYEEVARRYPSSAAAAQARDRLGDLR